MHNVLVTGAKGQLGAEISYLFDQYPGFRFIFAHKDILDITNKQMIDVFFTEKKIDIIINCAAYTSVDKAETDQMAADSVNHLAVENLLAVAYIKQIPFIHISTDYVFDGKGFRPYSINTPRNPQNVYGETKMKGEDAFIQSGLDNLMLIRTSWVYSSFGNNFVKTMLRLGAERESIGVIDDQVGSPTYARDLARFILESIPKIDWEGVKVFHFTNEGVCSWFDFAKAIMDSKGYTCKVIPIPTENYPTPAKRPHYSVLDKKETRKFYGKEIPHWRDSLEDCLKLI
jgi:dTDP-4-dehydrorhamnose reductase